MQQKKSIFSKTYLKCGLGTKVGLFGREAGTVVWVRSSFSRAALSSFSSEVRHHIKVNTYQYVVVGYYVPIITSKCNVSFYFNPKVSVLAQ